MTTMRSARASVARRWVMMIVVRSADELLQHLVDQLLALQVDLAGGFVEDQDRRVAEDRPGQGDPLPLAAGEAAAHRADDRVVAVGQVRSSMKRWAWACLAASMTCSRVACGEP